MKNVALNTYAVSCGFLDPKNLFPVARMLDPELAPQQGTALALDDHYLITAAHVCIWDTSSRSYSPKDVVYK